MITPCIVTVADSSYLLPLSVMIKSLEVNLRKGVKANVYILTSDLMEKEQAEFSSLFKGKELVIKWIRVDDSPLNGLKVDGHISLQTYYRLLIEDLFPTLDKVIYLDADIIINRCISDLWQLTFGGSSLLAVPMASPQSGFASGPRGLPAYKILDIPAATRVFNAGVMILNLKRWRKKSISAKVIKYLKEYPEYVLWWDQDGLNCTLYRQWKPLSVEWNVMACHIASFAGYEDSLYSETEFQQALRDPSIIHYAGPQKPWKHDYCGPFLNEYIYYLNRISCGINKSG